MYITKDHLKSMADLLNDAANEMETWDVSKRELNQNVLRCRFAAARLNLKADTPDNVCRPVNNEAVKHGTCNECISYEDGGCPVLEFNSDVDEKVFYCQQFTPIKPVKKSCGITKTG